MDAHKMLRDRVEKPAAELVRDRWRALLDDVAAHVRGVWAQEDAESGIHDATRALTRIDSYLDRELKGFRHEAIELVNAAMRQSYQLEYMSQTWILDQITPPNVKVRPKRDSNADYNPTARPRRKMGFRESWFTEPPQGTPQPGEQGAEPSHEHRIDAWLKAWAATAAAGLMLGGVQGDTPTDAADRIAGATAAGPSVENVLSRIVQAQVEVAAADAGDDFWTDQENLLVRRVWTTMDDEDVCEDCASQEGLTYEETDADIPRHPHCRCWWRQVALAYQEIAGDLAAPGVVRTSMAFRDPETGEIAGAVVIEFDTWAQALLP